jgi:hypothetical protein
VTSFVPDPQRDSSDVIAGFVFQIDLTIQRWLELKGDEILELERGEDLDVIHSHNTKTPQVRGMRRRRARHRRKASQTPAGASVVKMQY